MAESLTAEQMAERRTNLRAFRTTLGWKDDSEFTTTLLMQEEWLATVDELHHQLADARARLKAVREGLETLPPRPGLWRLRKILTIVEGE